MDEISWAQYVPTFSLPAKTPAGPRPLPTLTTMSFAQAETVSHQDAPVGTSGPEAHSSQVQEKHLFF